MVSVADLLRSVQCDRLDEVVARDLTRSLHFAGLRCKPNLFAILAERGESRQDPAQDDTVAFAAGAKRLDDAVVTIARSRALALTGVALATLVACSIAWFRWHPFALCALLGGLAAAVVVAGPPSAVLDRRLPPRAPRGRLLGAAVAGACTMAVLVLFGAARFVFGV